MKLRTIAEASDLLRKGKVSPVELTRECLETVARLNPTLNAFITVTAEPALQQAQRVEKEILSGRWRGPLHGIPIGLKDIIDTAGVRTTAASKVFRDRVPREDAEVVKKLKSAGAVLIGKHNLHEFAYGGSSLISAFGPVRNPVNPEFIAGGSSGGSAAAVATGMCYAAIGTDTAGSIRQPAALCGVVGLKPTYGLVSTHGIIPLSTSLDHAGPITRTVEDAAILLDAITGSSARYHKALLTGIRSLRCAIPRKFFFEKCDPEVLAAVEEAIGKLIRRGLEVRELELAIDEDRTVFNFESYAYHRERIASSPECYHPETLRRLRTCEGTAEAAYQNALRRLQNMRRDVVGMLEGMDLLITPTTPAPAPRIDDLLSDVSRLRPAELLLLRNTRPMNLWGLPAISVPCGVSSQGLPIGLQIAGKPGRENLVLAAAHAFMRSEP